MALLSQLIELLLRCPFDEHGHYKINENQCQALCLYFREHLERFFDTMLQPPTGNSSSSLSIKRRNSFFAIYDKTFVKLRLSRKVSKPSMANFEDHSSANAILEELRTVPNAVEELLRVMVEAETYLQACGNSEWWKTGFSLGFTTEVRDVHFHDLMWCIAGLKSALQTVRGVELDSWAQFTRLSLAQCYEEMGECSSTTSDLLNCEDQDNVRFNCILQQEYQKYDDMNIVRKMMVNIHEHGKHGALQSLIQRLRYPSYPSEVNSSSQNLPPSLCIMTKDLSFSVPIRIVAHDKYAQVNEASWHGIKVAAKQYNYNDFKEYFTYQVFAHAKLKYPFIIQFYGWSIDSHKVSCYLVLELVSDNLATLVKKRKDSNKSLCLPVILDLMLQLARALEFLHSKNVLHGDITPYNVLVRLSSSCGELMKKGYGRVKLSNFGYNRLKLDVADITSLGYRAPEVWASRGKRQIEQLEYTPEADVYSFGMTFAYCLLGEDPLAGITSVGSLRDVLQKGPTLRLPATCPLVLKELLHSCLSKSLSARPSFQSITMALRHLKLLLMKQRGPDELTNQTMIEQEFFLSTPVMSYVELCRVTSDFSTRVKNISLHSMYYGTLSDGRKVLIQQMQNLMNPKKLWLQTSQLLNLRHSNVAGLRAVCVESSRYWFVIENCVVRGSLDKWLEVNNTREQLDVATCYKIALGTACGLQYLHGQGILYTVTAENILLDERYEPQLLVSSVETENSDEDFQYHQRLDNVMHFGMLITKLLSYLKRNNLVEDNPQINSQTYVLQRVDNLCASASMEEVIEVLESIYDSCHEESLSLDVWDASIVDTAGSSKVMESCPESFTSFELTQNLAEYIDSLQDSLHIQDSNSKSI